VMWGIFVASLRYVSEYRAQKAEQDEGLRLLDAEHEIAGVAGTVGR
jgi:hypothetical protein